MPFAALSVQNRANVLEWANRHDWGRDAAMSPDGVLSGVVEVATANDSAARVRSLNFTCLRDLVSWAGY